MIKWTVKDVIDAFDKAMQDTPEGGSNQLLQQLKDRTQQGTRPPVGQPPTGQPQIRRQ